MMWPCGCCWKQSCPPGKTSSAADILNRNLPTADFFFLTADVLWCSCARGILGTVFNINSMYSSPSTENPFLNSSLSAVLLVFSSWNHSKITYYHIKHYNKPTESPWNIWLVCTSVLLTAFTPRSCPNRAIGVLETNPSRWGMKTATYCGQLCHQPWTAVSFWR